MEMYSSTEDRTIFCMKCGRKYSPNNILDTIFKLFCDDCFEIQKEELELNWSTAQKGLLDSCEVCLKSFNEIQPKIQHVCTRNGVYCCTDCNRQFLSEECKNKHINIKHKEIIKSSENVDCVRKEQTAKKKKVRKKELLSNNIFEEGIIFRPFVCEICKKAFKRCTTLCNHRKTHTRPYICNVCGMAFSKNCNLKTHMHTHINEKPFMCDTCGKYFRRRSHLNDHIRIHTGDRPYICEYCSKSFMGQSDLRQHIGIHLGRKPFDCNFCGKAFSRMSRLKMHKNTHTGEKPFRCKLCPKSFAHDSNLIKHNRVHNKNK